MEGSLKTDSLSRSQSLFSSGVLSVSSGCEGADEPDSFDNANYEVRDRLGEGSYGVVVSAGCTSRAAAGCERGSVVAIKMVSSSFAHNTLLAKRTLREIAMLRRLRHPNVISVLDLYRGASGRLFLVLNLMDTDLAQIIESGQPLRAAHVTYLAFQLLRGVEYLHACGLLHRDLKPANVLVNEDCSVRIADMGMARLCCETTPANDAAEMTEYVVSRWWRGPEVMVDLCYSYPLDIWSVGCIVGELLQRKPLFPGRDYGDQLVKIIAVLGKPAPDVVARMADAGARDFVSGLREYERIAWHAKFPRAEPALIELLEGCLAFEPGKRLAVTELLKLPLFVKLNETCEKPDAAGAKLLSLDWKEEDIASVADVEVLLEKELEDARRERDIRLAEEPAEK